MGGLWFSEKEISRVRKTKHLEHLLYRAKKSVVDKPKKEKQKRQRGARCATWLGGSLGRQADS